MTKEELNRISELTDILLKTSGKEYDRAYEEYKQLTFKQAKEYRQENETELRNYYEKHIKGRSWRQIDPQRWEFYSDWHKDVYGYRPRMNLINERGV